MAHFCNAITGPDQYRNNDFVVPRLQLKNDKLITSTFLLIQTGRNNWVTVNKRCDCNE